MSIRSMARVSIIFTALMLFGVHSTALAASSKLQNETRVVVAEDKTKEAQCVSWIDSPANEKPCLPGSVIFARETTYAEVKRSGIVDYVVLTGNATEDTKSINRLVDRVHMKVAPKQRFIDAVVQSCTSVTGKQIGGSYLSDPLNPNSIRIYYQVRYDVNTYCAVRSVFDQSRTSSGGLTWDTTCTGKDIQGTWTGCTTWNQSINTTWTGWFPEQSSNIGQQYTHISYIGLFKARPYGYTYFVN